MTSLKYALFACVLGVMVHAQTPTLASVNNAASYSTAIAQGSIFVAFGANMGPAQLVQAPSLPLGTTLSGTSMRFTPTAGGGAPVDAFIVYTSAGQLAGILPSTAAPGLYNATVTYNGATSAPTQARVVARAFGMVSLSGTGTGLAVMQNASAGSRVVQFGAPARPGQVMVLYGTGLGPIRVADNIAPGAQDLRADAAIRVVVGNVEVTPDYAGRSSSPGLDQINFTVPMAAPLGCSVPLTIRVGDTVSPQGTIAISNAAQDVCTHPFLSADALRRLDARGTVTYASFSLTSWGFSFAVPLLGNIPINTESAGGGFFELGLANLPAVEDELASQIGMCSVTRGRVDGSGQVLRDVPVRALDAGTITLNGPGVANRAFTRSPGNLYNLSLSTPSFNLTPGGGTRVIAAGSYTLAGAGGAAVGPFTATLPIAAPVTWTNRAQITEIRRSNPLTVNWTGGSADDLVTISGSAGTLVPGSDGIYDGALFVCTARASAGTFTVPTSILQQMPAAEGLSLTGLTPNLNSIAVLTVNVSSGNPPRISAPLTAGGNVEFGTFTYSFGGGAFVPYR